MIKAVIYDFDDTVADADPLHVLSWEETLKEHRITNFEGFRDWKAANLIGKSSLQNAEQIVKRYKLNTTPQAFYLQKTELLNKLAKEHLKLLPGVLYSLKLFKNKGLRLAIASGSPRGYIEMNLKKFNIFDYFDVIITSDDITKSKPDPQTYIITCQKLGLDPDECVVLEDATAGIQSAKATGCKCIAIPNIHVPTQDYSQADLVLDSLEKLNLKEVLCL